MFSPTRASCTLTPGNEEFDTLANTVAADLRRAVGP